MEFKEQLNNLAGQGTLEKVISLLFITGTIALEYVMTHPASFLLTVVTLLWTYERYRKEKALRKQEELKLKNDERTIGNI